MLALLQVKLVTARLQECEGRASDCSSRVAALQATLPVLAGQLKVCIAEKHQDSKKHPI
jgi:hypothetical protein